MQSNKRTTLLQQLPAPLMFKRRGETSYCLNAALLKLFGFAAGKDYRAKPTVFRFYDPLTKRELIGEECPFQKIEKSGFASTWVRLKTSERGLLCFITGSVIKNDDTEWLVFHIEANNHLMEINSERAGAKRHIEFNQLLTKFSSKLINASANDLDIIISQSLAAFGEFCDVDRCYLFEFTDNLQLMSNTHEWVAAGVTPYIDQLQSMPTSEMPYLMYHIKQGLFKIDDVGNIPDSAIVEREEFQKENICSILCSRIIANGKTHGFIGCDITGSPYTWSPSDIEYLQRIGDMLGNTLQNIYNRKAIHTMQLELIEANKQLQKLANIDGLTGIANRRLFNSTLDKDLAQSCRKQDSLSLLLIDVDFFKLYNDQYGHVAGDNVLQKVAQTLVNSCVGTDDLVARYGGEEFAVILPATTTDRAKEVANRIIGGVKGLGIKHEASPLDGVLTVSIGIATQADNCDGNCIELIDKADKALYRAKSTGRGRVCA
ncbi:sensor domain-containing diguanylate cyclase [Alteromonas sp. BMJM2]|uniref:sensor domain-containing diguanylate cyclase n=1 Tax=Alteromonas sp. BMJM2 TaxID=2954241 RepID=UPI0022B3B0BC|nr:diguanylate cyclase [Alteromonas sp. BMJM2]